MLAAYLMSFPLVSQVEYNCELKKMDWLTACIALRVVGAVFGIFMRKICATNGNQGPIPAD